MCVCVTCQATGCTLRTRFRQERLKQTQQIVRWFLRRSAKANASHTDYLNPPRYLHNNTDDIIIGIMVIQATHLAARRKGSNYARSPITALREMSPARRSPAVGAQRARGTSRPRGGAAPPGPALAPAPAPAPRLVGRAGPRPPPAGVTPSMQRGALLPLPPLPLPGGEDGGGRRGGFGDSAHGRRGAAQNRPPQGRHLVREERGGARVDRRGRRPPAPGAACLPEGPTSFPSPPLHRPLPGAARRLSRCRESGGG